MKLYKVNGTGKFIYESGEVNDEALVKLKISMVLPTALDVDLYAGRLDAKYPITPGHMATAVVSEDREEYGLKRGAKVIINPYILSSVDAERLAQVKRYGLDEDGFLRDFVAVPIDNVIPFPEDVKENEAVFTEFIALGLEVLEALKPCKGDYIAIVGDSILMNIVAQLALYYQAIPIMVLKDARYIALAEKCGIYYIINELKEDVAFKVLSITGGRMANHTVLHAQPGVTAQFCYSLARNSGDSVIVGTTANAPHLDIDIAGVIKKQITLKGVYSAEDEIISAINILALKELKLQFFADKTVPIEDSEILFEELAKNISTYVAPMIKDKI